MYTFSWSSRWGYLILPSICVFGFITNLTNIAVFLNPKMKDVSFKYLLAISISDFLYVCLLSYSYIEICTECPFYNLYSTQFYLFYIKQYLTSCLAIFCILTDITLSLLRYLVLKNKTYLKSVNYFKIIGFIILISLIYYTPLLFFKNIISINQSMNSTTEVIDAYILKRNSLGLSLYGTVTPIILQTIRIILAMIFLFGINIMNVIEFRKRFSNRIRIHASNNPESMYILINYKIKYLFFYLNKGISLRMISNRPNDQLASNEQSIINVNDKQSSKKNTKNEEKAARNITLMVIFHCVLYICGNYIFCFK